MGAPKETVAKVMIVAVTVSSIALILALITVTLALLINKGKLAMVGVEKDGKFELAGYAKIKGNKVILPNRAKTIISTDVISIKFGKPFILKNKGVPMVAICGESSTDIKVFEFVEADFRNN